MRRPLLLGGRGQTGSIPCSQKDSPVAHLARRACRLRHSPAKTSGGMRASSSAAARTFSSSGHSGCWCTLNLRQLCAPCGFPLRPCPGHAAAVSCFKRSHAAQCAEAAGVGVWKAVRQCLPGAAANAWVAAGVSGKIFGVGLRTAEAAIRISASDDECVGPGCGSVRPTGCRDHDQARCARAALSVASARHKLVPPAASGQVDGRERGETRMPFSDLAIWKVHAPADATPAGAPRPA